MKLIYIKLFCLIICLVPMELLAQNIIKGVVRDEFGTVPSANVTLVNKEDRVVGGVAANENGEYFLSLPANAKGMYITFSFIGLKTQKIEYTGQTVLDITLQESTSTSLQEVTISAKSISNNLMGINADNTGVARQKLYLDEYQDMSVISAADMLQGKLTNVDIIGGGDPGSKASIRIRGTSSLNANNEPLIVIDDIPYETDISSDFDFGTADYENIGGLVSISPNDIESIEVLKDAGATALYGSKAANGVLVIKTKRGRTMKTQFLISQKFTYVSEPKGVPMLKASEYTTLMEDALWNTMQFVDFNKYSDWRKKYESMRYDPTSQYFNEMNQETDWVDLITRDVISTNTDFSMEGGGDKAAFRFSVNHMSENGTTIGTSFVKLTARLNLDYKLSNKIQVSSNFSYSEGDRDKPYEYKANGTGAIVNVRSVALNKMPNMSPYIIDPITGQATDQYFSQPANSIQKQEPNPVAWVQKSQNNTLDRSSQANFTINYTPMSDLKLVGNVSFALNTNKYKQFMPAEASGSPWLDVNVLKPMYYYNNSFQGNASSMSLYSKLMAVYNKNIEKHKILLSGATEVREGTGSSYSAAIRAIGSPELIDPSAGGIVYSLESGDSKNRSMGLLAQGHYEFDSRYSTTIGMRSDANSQTGRNSRWGTFPTVAAQWRINNEAFLNKEKWLNDMRLRISWGQSGNSPQGSYTYVGTLTTENPYLNLPAVKPNNMQLNKLKWETTTSLNAGYQISFLDDKIALEVDWYKKTTNDLLQKDMKIPSSTGYSEIGHFNSGSLENKGWEIALNLNNILKIKDVSVSFTNLNISRNRNVVKELPTNKTEEAYEAKNGKYANRILEGRPLGSFFGYNSLGVYQNVEETYARDPQGNVIKDIYGEPVFMKYFGSTQAYPGDAKYADHNYDGVIDKYDMVYLGNSMPTIIGGGGIKVNYKSLMIRMSFQFRLGQKIINGARMDGESMNDGSNQRRSVLKRWRYEGDDTNIPRALYQNGYNYLGSDRFVEDNSFLRCKDITISYNLPKKLLNSLSIQRCNVFITTFNPFTITKYKGQDPEVRVPGGFDQLAVDGSFTPPSKRIAFGFSVGI